MTKMEIFHAYLGTDDDIIICDPEAEYYPLVQKLGGQVIRISPISTDYINPLDINVNYSEEENPLTLKSDFILSMCELIVGGKDGLQPVEKTIIDRSVRMVYQDYLADPVPEKMPILEDLYNILRNQTEPEAQRIATALEIYVHGSLNVFNHRTNVDVNNRFVCIDFFDKAFILICRKVSGFNCLQQFFLILTHEIKNLVFIGAIIPCCDKEKEKSTTQDIRATGQRKHHDYRQKQG